MLTDTTQSPFARLSAVPAGTVTACGALARTVQRTAEVTVPTMAALLYGHGHAVENFRIAAGEREGSHEGPPFMDGDLYKWLEAVAALQSYDSDPQRAAWLEELSGLIGRAQREDGYVHTQTLVANRAAGQDRPLDDRLNFETYNLGHLMTAGVVAHRATGDDTLLEAGRRAAAYLLHLLDDVPELLARSAICPSHYMGVIELYRVTRDPDHLRLAKALLEIRDSFEGGSDDNQDRVPLREQTVVAGHAVRANYLYAGAADLVAETGDEELLRVLTRLWDDLVSTKLYVTGGCGALYDGASPDGDPEQWHITRVHQAYGRAFQLPNVTAHNESCAAIGLVLWAWRMLALTGDGRYADAIETVLLNALPATIGIDGKSYFYTNALRQVAGLPYPLRRPGDTAIHPVPAPPPSDERLRQEWLSCFCCPPNIARTLAELPYLTYGLGGRDLWVHQFAASRVAVEIDGRPFTLEQHTDFPTSGRVRLVVGEGGRVALHVRIPAWASGATLSVNGTPVDVLPELGYVVLDRAWAKGDEVVLDLPMETRVLVAHRFAEEIANHGCVVRGPVVYCAESVDQPLSGLLLPATAEFSESVDRGFDGEDTVVLSTSARRVRVETDSLYGPAPADSPVPTPLRLVPYARWANRGPGEMSVWLPLTW
ncbi:MAG TPA: beta-L-arabinofuranosidase domain-containing protein [Propionibacteriaceae bacterium]|nr:beta-L-arabinofuranosidase domain-containing protein [Propionibacteriaceae bacterium]